MTIFLMHKRSNMRKLRPPSGQSIVKEFNLQCHEKEKAEREIQGWDLADYCSVLQF